MPDTYKGQWEHICGRTGLEVYFPRSSVNFCPYCGIPRDSPDEHPAIHWERIAGFEVDNKLWAKGSVRVLLEPTGGEVAPDGESRPPTPSSRVATEYPDGNFPQLWSRNYIKQLIREEIQEAFAQRVRDQNAAWVRIREGGY